MHIPRITLAAAFAVSLVVPGYAVAQAQPHQQAHMQKALADLEDAKKELALAERDKGGHRKQAAQMVDEAISQVHEGMDVSQRDAQRPSGR